MTFVRRKPTKRSPLKDRPLRSAGQSLDEEIHHLIDDSLSCWMFITAALVLVAALEWLEYFLGNPPNPVTYSILVVISVGFLVWKIIRIRSRVHLLRQGRDGERFVGQYLEGLRAKGFKVFHDVLGDGFNVDHVLIGPPGIYSVETKTFSKPVGRDARIKYSDGKLRVDERPVERDPLRQAKAGARWIKKILEESTGKEHRVRPVVLFPGWFVEPMPRELTATLWVLEPKALPKFLDNEPIVLSEPDIALASYHLSRLVQANSASLF